ncbi:MAG TPA: PilZ domain-containing protein [Chromatiales bacterium]|nr:PilZ domain-containing protein [Chromatiales bacterium]
MEQRWSPRTRADLDVDLSFRGEIVSECKVRDIGMGGLFVEVEKAYPRDTVVELKFKIQSDGQETRHRIRATVARTCEQGLGMMFCDFDAGTFRSLQEVLHYVQGQGGATPPLQGNPLQQAH